MTIDQEETFHRYEARGAPAAIAIFAFRRLDLIQQTLSSLVDAEGFGNSPIYVFSDAARRDVADEKEAVEAVRAWLRDWSAMHRAKMHESPVNRGLRPSIVAGVTGVLEHHERIIVLEDDLIVSPSFLLFMDGALEAYRDRDQIMQVSGYNVPHQAKLSPIGLLRTPASWGWASASSR